MPCYDEAVGNCGGSRTAVLTCKSFVRAWYRGERLIEPPSSWFPSKFPSGSLELQTVSPIDGPCECRKFCDVEHRWRVWGIVHRSPLVVKLQRGTLCPAACPLQASSCAWSCPLTNGNGCVRCPSVLENDVDSTWAITGKQYWRCGVIREHGYGVLLQAHLEPTKDVVYSR